MIASPHFEDFEETGYRLCRRSAVPHAPPARPALPASRVVPLAASSPGLALCDSDGELHVYRPAGVDPLTDRALPAPAPERYRLLFRLVPDMASGPASFPAPRHCRTPWELVAFVPSRPRCLVFVPGHSAQVMLCYLPSRAGTGAGALAASAAAAALAEAALAGFGPDEAETGAAAAAAAAVAAAETLQTAYDAGARVVALGTHAHRVRCVAVDVKGHVLVSGDEGGMLKLWPLTDGAFDPASHGAHSLGDYDHSARRPQAHPTTVRAHEAPVLSACHLTNRRVATGSTDKVVRVWALAAAATAALPAGRLEATLALQLHVGLCEVCSVASVLSAEGEVVAVGTAEGTVSFWDSTGGGALQYVATHTTEPIVRLCGVAGRGAAGADTAAPVVVAGDTAGTVRVYRAATGTEAEADALLDAALGVDDGAAEAEVPTVRRPWMLVAETDLDAGAALATVAKGGRELVVASKLGMVKRFDVDRIPVTAAISVDAASTAHLPGTEAVAAREVPPPAVPAPPAVPRFRPPVAEYAADPAPRSTAPRPAALLPAPPGAGSLPPPTPTSLAVAAAALAALVPPPGAAPPPPGEKQLPRGGHEHGRKQQRRAADRADESRPRAPPRMTAMPSRDAQPEPWPLTELDKNNAVPSATLRTPQLHSTLYVKSLLEAVDAEAFAYAGPDESDSVAAEAAHAMDVASDATPLDHALPPVDPQVTAPRRRLPKQVDPRWLRKLDDLRPTADDFTVPDAEPTVRFHAGLASAPLGEGFGLGVGLGGLHSSVCF